MIVGKLDAQGCYEPGWVREVTNEDKISKFGCVWWSRSGVAKAKRKPKTRGQELPRLIEIWRAQAFPGQSPSSNAREKEMEKEIKSQSCGVV